MHKKKWQKGENTEKKLEAVPESFAFVNMSACVFPALTFVDVERDGANCDANHAFWVVEKLNGFGVQGKVISVLRVGDREEAPVSKASHSNAQTIYDREMEKAAGQKC